MTIRSGCLHSDCITLGVIPEELDAMIESGGVAASISTNNLILKSGRSGPFSWTKSACDSASFMLVVKLRRSRDAPEERPMSVSAGHASSTYLRRLASAFGAGSVAITSNPRARYCAAQLAPITPVPTIAIRCTGFFKLILVSPECFALARLSRITSCETSEPRWCIGGCGAGCKNGHAVQKGNVSADDRFPQNSRKSAVHDISIGENCALGRMS